MPTLENEENRGLFVLGVVAVLIVLHYDQTISQSIWRIPVDILLLLWTSYALLVVVALSKDVFGARLSDIAYTAAQFMVGCSLWYIVSFGLLYILWTLVPPFEVHISKCTNDCLLTINAWSSWSLWAALPAFLFPPVPAAVNLSKTYGRRIWILYPAILALLTVFAGHLLQLLLQSAKIVVLA
jgi:hypothetical protein